MCVATAWRVLLPYLLTLSGLVRSRGYFRTSASIPVALLPDVGVNTCVARAQAATHSACTFGENASPQLFSRAVDPLVSAAWPFVENPATLGKVALALQKLLGLDRPGSGFSCRQSHRQQSGSTICNGSAVTSACLAFVPPSG